MKKYVLLAAFVVFTAALSFAQVQDSERQVIDLAQRKFLWITQNRTDSLKTILDDRVQYIHSNGWIQTKADVLADFENGKLKYDVIDVKEINARVYGKAAIVVGRGKFTGVNTGAPFAVDLLFTEVYILKNKGWQLVSRHANKMP